MSLCVKYRISERERGLINEASRKNGNRASWLWNSRRSGRENPNTGKRSAFKALLKVDSESLCLRSNGSSFHVADP